MEAVVYDGAVAKYVTDYPKPECKPGYSLIKIKLAAVCNTDKEVRAGYKPDFRGVMGHEFVGVVEDSDDKSWIGKRVVGELNEACGHCIYCKTMRPTHCINRKVIGLNKKDGCFAAYMTLATTLLHEIPDDLPDEQAIFTEPLAAAIELTTQAQLDVAKNVAVLGDGRLSLMITEVLSLYGMDITVIGHHPEKLELFKPYAKTTLAGEPQGYEYVVEATGVPAGMKDALELVRKRGTIFMKSTYAGDAQINLSSVVVNEIKLVGSRCGPFEPALRLLERKLIQFPSIELFSLQDFQKAFSWRGFKAGFKINS